MEFSHVPPNPDASNMAKLLCFVIQTIFSQYVWMGKNTSTTVFIRNQICQPLWTICWIREVPSFLIFMGGESTWLPPPLHKGWISISKKIYRFCKVFTHLQNPRWTCTKEKKTYILWHLHIYIYINIHVHIHMINIDQVYIYISKVHQHSCSKIGDPSTIPWRANVRIAAKMF